MVMCFGLKIILIQDRQKIEPCILRRWAKRYPCEGEALRMLVRAGSERRRGDIAAPFYICRLSRARFKRSTPNGALKKLLFDKKHHVSSGSLVLPFTG